MNKKDFISIFQFGKSRMCFLRMHKKYNDSKKFLPPTLYRGYYLEQLGK